MLSFIRRLTHSRIGIIVTFVALIVIALAFAAGGVSRIGSGGPGGLKATTVAQVGDSAISANDLRDRVRNQMDSARQQNPSLTMAQFVAQGGFDGTLTQVISALVLEKFGNSQGMVVSKKAIDGVIASLPVFQGADGKFDSNIYRQILAQQNLTDAGLRADIRREAIAQQLTAPTIGASQVPSDLALPYASLLLEKRSGQIGFIPTRAIGAGAQPTDAELQTFYKHDIASYTVPERRVIRYAVIAPDRVKAQAAASDAEIAQAYKAQADRFAPKETRTLKQVIVADQNAAQTIATKVKGGISIEAAAKAAGLEAATLDALQKDAYATQSSAAAADAAFGASEGEVVGPVKTPLGFAVVRVDKVTHVAGKSLAEARAALAPEIETQKSNQLLGKIHDDIDDAITDNSTFAEIVGDQKLQPQQTPPVVASGANPDDLAAKPDPLLSQVIAAGFDAEQGDDPQMVQVGQDGGFAVVSLANIIPATPRPIAQIHDQVVKDFSIDRAQRAARKIAADVVAKVNKGTALKQALADTKLKLPPAQPLAASRAQLASNPQGAPPPLALMFSMQLDQAKLLAAPNDAGWLIVYLEGIKAGDAGDNDAIKKGTRNDLGRLMGREYTQQFIAAARRTVGSTRNEAAIADVRNELLGNGAGDQP